MKNTLAYMILVLFLLYTLALGASSDMIPSNDGLCKLRVQIFGYACEEHKVTTPDGYILSMQRIPTGRSGDTTGSRPPVLLQHGILLDGITWLFNPPDQALAFILADNGFDVWVANTRGTNYSRGHTSLSPDDPAYWDWTVDDLMEYELPAIFGYVNNQTRQKLYFVGHSQGTLMALTSLSKLKLLDMLRSAALLSPIAYLGQLSSPILRPAAKNFVAETLYKLGIYEFDPSREVVSNLLLKICKKQGRICNDTVTALTGKNCCVNSLPIGVIKVLEPTATKNLVQYAQLIRSGRIAMFDYGSDNENIKHYGQSTSPDYDLKNIPNGIPLFLSYGGQDVVSDVIDVQRLLNDLKDHDRDKLVVQYREDYAHLDFIFGVNANKVVYDPLMAFFRLH